MWPDPSQFASTLCQPTLSRERVHLHVIHDTLTDSLAIRAGKFAMLARWRALGVGLAAARVGHPTDPNVTRDRNRPDNRTARATQTVVEA